MYDGVDIKAFRAGEEDKLLFGMDCFSVTVDEDECDDEGAAWPAGVDAADEGASAIEGDGGTSSSGLAIRKPV